MTVMDLNTGAVMPVTEDEFDLHPEYVPVSRVELRDSSSLPDASLIEPDYELEAVREWERGLL